MELTKSSRGDLLHMELAGPLDNESSAHLQNALDDAVRGGWHRILLNLEGVTYVSSAGIGVLLRARKQLDELHGLFGIWNLTPPVEQILQQTKVLKLLLRNPAEIPASAATGSMTFQSETRMAVEEGVSFQRYTLGEENDLHCRLFGEPERFASNGYDISDTREVPFPIGSFGLGLGSLGNDGGTPSGELLAISGAVTQASTTSRGLPDYLLAQGDYCPSARMMYGLRCDGSFAELIRFEAWDGAPPIPFSRLIGHLLKLTGYDTAGIVLVAESAGLVGTRLRKGLNVPTTVNSADSSLGRFAFPEIREWLTFSAEQVYRQSLVLIAGVVRRVSSGDENSRPDGEQIHESAATGTINSTQVSPSSPSISESSSPNPLDRFLRPIDDANSLQGHFHAAVFPYRPLKKRTLKLQPLVTDLFDAGDIQDVLHLLRHHQPLSGTGESELTSGGCWISPIKDVTVEDQHA